ncbi:MAG: hypothetical protein V3W41_09900 [Planctomycetota bacterium]
MIDTTNTPKATSSVLAWLVIIGVAVFVLGLFLAPERVWPSWLVSVNLFMGLCLAGPVFIAIMRLTSGRWADPIMPVARAMGSGLPLAVLMAVFVVFGASTLYDWSHMEAGHVSKHMEHKLGWLNLGAFSARAAVCFFIWLFITPWMLKKTGRGRAGIWMILFGLSFSVFVFDWLMSLEAEWFSTMFAVYLFAGLFQTGIAAITLIALQQERLGHLKLADSVRHDLGKLLFAFSFFWGYIWFCQYMLIWYTNIPEETTWFHARLSGGWTTMTLLSLAVSFVVPFLVLLPAPAKRNRATLARVAMLILVGRWLDLYIIVTPASSPGVPPLGFWEIAPPVAAAAGFFLWTRRWLAVNRVLGDAIPAGLGTAEPSGPGSAEPSDLAVADLDQLAGADIDGLAAADIDGLAGAEPSKG